MTTATLDSGNTLILLIEDDPAIGESLVDALKTHGFRVTWHTTGGAGMAAAHTTHPHLILLDLRLPDGSGLDFCRQLRQEGLHQPVIILTAQRDEIDKVLGLEMGADDYVTKPFGLRELLSRIRAQVRRAYGEFAPTATDADVLRAGHLTLDLDRGQVCRDDTILNLTPHRVQAACLSGAPSRPGGQPRATPHRGVGLRRRRRERPHCQRPHQPSARQGGARPQPPRPHPHRARHRLPAGWVN